MNEVTITKTLGLTELLLKHIELGNVKLFRYESVSDIRKIINKYNSKYGWVFKDPQNRVVGVRTTDQPLTDDVLYEPKEQHILIQDNGGCNDVPFSKITVKISNTDLEREIKKYFKWRKDATAKRLYKQASYKYDAFIKYLAEKGYPSH